MKLQAALDRIDQETQSANPSQSLISAKVRGLMRGYHVRWSDAPYVVDTVEEFVQSDLWNPETDRKSRSFTLAGKIDVKAWHGQRRVIMDHKTCSEDITDPNAPYWRQLIIEAQPSHYMLLEWLNGRKADDAVWDVVRKPTISPKAVTKADLSDILRTKHYFGRALTEPTVQELRETGRENHEMYEARLAWDCTDNRPEWYFQRRSVPRMDSEIHEWATELWGHSQDLLIARRENRWPRNSGACMNYGRPCPFLGICSGYDTPESDHWKRKRQVHVELDLAGDGKDVLTNSRIRSFQTCRRKHFYQYELGIERADEEEAESLYFGTLWHSALETWFLALKGEQKLVNDSSAAPVTEVGNVANIDTAPVAELDFF